MKYSLVMVLILSTFAALAEDSGKGFGFSGKGMGLNGDGVLDCHQKRLPIQNMSNGFKNLIKRHTLKLKRKIPIDIVSIQNCKCV